MATGEKPYRVYRGGRVKGRVPLERPQQRQERDGTDAGLGPLGVLLVIVAEEHGSLPPGARLVAVGLKG